MEHELFANQRYVGQISVGAVAHQDVMRAIELFGTEVAPLRSGRAGRDRDTCSVRTSYRGS